MTKSRVEIIVEAHPYIEPGAARAILVVFYNSMEGDIDSSQQLLDDYTEHLVSLNKKEMLDLRSVVSESFEDPLSIFNDAFDEN
jgi:hypothetical protein